MVRKKVGMLFAEAMGAAVLTWVALAVSMSLGLPYFTGIAVGTALGLLVLTIGNASGAHVNPAVTLGFWSVRKIPTLQAIAYIISQLLGAWGAGRLFATLTSKPMESIAEKDFSWKVLLAEAIGTFVFTFGIAAAVYQGYKGLRLAVTVGTSLFLGILIAAVASNGVLNPAVALGIESVSRGYIVGPLIGALVGMNVYALLFAETAQSLVTVRTNAPVSDEDEVPVRPSSVKTSVKKANKKNKR